MPRRWTICILGGSTLPPPTLSHLAPTRSTLKVANGIKELHLRVWMVQYVVFLTSLLGLLVIANRNNMVSIKPLQLVPNWNETKVVFIIKAKLGFVSPILHFTSKTKNLITVEVTAVYIVRRWEHGWTFRREKHIKFFTNVKSFSLESK